MSSTKSPDRSGMSFSPAQVRAFNQLMERLARKADPSVILRSKEMIDVRGAFARAEMRINGVAERGAA